MARRAYESGRATHTAESKKEREGDRDREREAPHRNCVPTHIRHRLPCLSLSLSPSITYLPNTMHLHRSMSVSLSHPCPYTDIGIDTHTHTRTHSLTHSLPPMRTRAHVLQSRTCRARRPAARPPPQATRGAAQPATRACGTCNEKHVPPHSRPPLSVPCVCVCVCVRSGIRPPISMRLA
jgi:hypothetical protein